MENRGEWNRQRMYTLTVKVKWGKIILIDCAGSSLSKFICKCIIWQYIFFYGIKVVLKYIIYFLLV